MTIDRYTKFVLTVIALGLLLNGLNPWMIPTKAYAEIDSGDLLAIQMQVIDIATNVSGISSGVCVNKKLC